MKRKWRERDREGLRKKGDRKGGKVKQLESEKSRERERESSDRYGRQSAR